MDDASVIPFADIAHELLHGRVTPFIGAGVNHALRPQGATWNPQSAFLPDGGELASHLVTRFRLDPPQGSEPPDLLRTAQEVAVQKDTRMLYDALGEVFRQEVGVTDVHRFLAAAQSVLRDRGRRCQVIVTTNYDDLMERALQEAGEAFDVVWYQARPKHKSRGKFFHTRWDPGAGVFHPPGSAAVRSPTSWAEADLSKRATVLKVHGAIDRVAPEGDSYVITEDDYIDYMAVGDVLRQIPSVLVAPMQTGRLLFLGYSLRDWNLRVILRGIIGRQELDTDWWSVQVNVSDLERRFWAARGRVRLFDHPLDAFISRLRQEMDEAAAPA